MKKRMSLKMFFEKLVGFFDSLAIIVFSGIILLVIAHVLSRDLFAQPISGTFDLVSLFIGMVVVLALGKCTLEKGHVAIDFIIDFFPARVQKLIDIIVSSFMLIIFCFFTYHLAKYAYSMYLVREVSLTLRIPVYPFIFATTTGLLIVNVAVLLQLIERVREE